MMANCVDYTREQAANLADRIRRELPTAQVETYRDYGFSVDVRLGDKAIVACQPFIRGKGQPSKFLSLEAIKCELGIVPCKRHSAAK
jgi:hypothetical protein